MTKCHTSCMIPIVLSGHSIKSVPRDKTIVDYVIGMRLYIYNHYIYIYIFKQNMSKTHAFL